MLGYAIIDELLDVAKEWNRFTNKGEAGGARDCAYRHVCG